MIETVSQLFIALGILILGLGVPLTDQELKQHGFTQQEIDNYNGRD